MKLSHHLYQHVEWSSQNPQICHAIFGNIFFSVRLSKQQLKRLDKLGHNTSHSWTLSHSKLFSMQQLILVSPLVFSASSFYLFHFPTYRQDKTNINPLLEQEANGSFCFLTTWLTKNSSFHFNRLWFQKEVTMYSTGIYELYTCCYQDSIVRRQKTAALSCVRVTLCLKIGAESATAPTR